MGSIDGERRFSLDQFARVAELKQELEVLKEENSRLKGLVVRLSETIIRNVSRARHICAAPDSNFQLRQNASFIEQGCADLSSDSTDQNHSFTPNPRRASPSLRPDLSFRYTHGFKIVLVGSIQDMEPYSLRARRLLHERDHALGSTVISRIDK